MRIFQNSANKIGDPPGEGVVVAGVAVIVMAGVELGEGVVVAGVAEIMEQTPWGNEHFKVRDTCLYLKAWISKGILYVKDLINENGKTMCDEEMYNLVDVKRDIYTEIMILKNYVLNRIKNVG